MLIRCTVIVFSNLLRNAVRSEKSLHMCNFVTKLGRNIEICKTICSKSIKRNENSSRCSVLSYTLNSGVSDREHCFFIVGRYGFSSEEWNKKTSRTPTGLYVMRLSDLAENHFVCR